MKSNRPTFILLAFAVILSTSALAVEAPSSPIHQPILIISMQLFGFIEIGKGLVFQIP